VVPVFNSIPPLSMWLQARTLAFRKAHANIDATIRCVEGVLERYEVTGQVRKDSQPFLSHRSCLGTFEAD